MSNSIHVTVRPSGVWRALLVLFAIACPASADEWELMKTHCGKCHLKAEPEGDFSLRSLGRVPDKESCRIVDCQCRLCRAW